MPTAARRCRFIVAEIARREFLSSENDRLRAKRAADRGLRFAVCQSGSTVPLWRFVFARNGGQFALDVAGTA
jgi:hypothetical protein